MRSLWRTKLRLFAVIFMVSVGVFAGITFGGYSHNLDGMYSTMQADDDNGANLADIWISFGVVLLIWGFWREPAPEA